MPLCFTFVKDGEVVKLDDIDREICEEFGVTYSATNYCMPYQVLTTVGLAILCKMKVDPITKESFDAYIASEPDSCKDDAQTAKFRKFLYEKYTFTGWYQRHK